MPHVTLEGDLHGEYVVTQQHPDGTLVLEPDTSARAILRRMDARPATGDEFDAWAAEHGPLLPAGRRRLGPDDQRPRPGHARVRFDELAWARDLAAATPAGRDAAQRVRAQLDRDGAAVRALRACEGYGHDTAETRNSAFADASGPVGPRPGSSGRRAADRWLCCGPRRSGACRGVWSRSRAWPSSSAAITRSVPPRTSVVANECLST